MADCSTPGGFAVNQLLAVRPLPWWLWGNPADWGTVDTTGVLSGTVQRLGTPIANAWVSLYYRKTGVLIGRTISASDGTFTFGPSVIPLVGLNKSVSDYFILVNDPQDSLNAVIFDLLTPV